MSRPFAVSFSVHSYVSRAVMTRAGSKHAPALMVNSCSGKMGHATAEAVLRAGCQLVPYTLDISSEGSSIDVSGQAVQRVGPHERDEVVRKLKEQHHHLMMIDFTVPDAVNPNAELYCQHRVPFVMGTTGGNREKLLDAVQQAKLFAVIAPQMGKQVVAFQAMMQHMAHAFPGAFEGYTLEVVESHQSTKVDTSGTAKAVVASLQQLGIQHFSVDDIQKVRTDAESTDKMGVPPEHLGGHAFHTYRLRSPDGTVGFEFQHNVCGRTIYADGSVDAALFLHESIQAGGEPRVFNMIDVLQAGSMR